MPETKTIEVVIYTEEYPNLSITLEFLVVVYKLVSPQMSLITYTLSDDILVVALPYFTTLDKAYPTPIKLHLLQQYTIGLDEIESEKFSYLVQNNTLICHDRNVNHVGIYDLKLKALLKTEDETIKSEMSFQVNFIAPPLSLNVLIEFPV